jgi:AcrR family transcriptional regulator
MQREPVKRRTAIERREEVIRAAIAEFATYGLHGGSTERIAELAGISQPYVLRLFGTKKALFLAALERVCEEILAGWKGAIAALEQRAGSDAATPRERLAAMGAVYEDIVPEVLRLRLLLQGFAAAEDHDVRDQTQAWMGRFFDWVTRSSGAAPEHVQAFFAQGMLLTVAASIGAPDKSDSDAWARTILMRPTIIS